MMDGEKGVASGNSIVQRERTTLRNGIKGMGKLKNENNIGRE
jgi:hypothetical protein